MSLSCRRRWDFKALDDFCLELDTLKIHFSKKGGEKKLHLIYFLNAINLKSKIEFGTTNDV